MPETVATSSGTRHRPRKRLPCLLATLGSIVAAAAGAPVDPPPVEAFGMRPFVDHVLISPAGTHYACVQWENGIPFVAVYDLRESADERRQAMQFKSAKGQSQTVRGIHWLNDDTVGLVIDFEAYRRGVPTRETRLAAIERDMSRVRWIPETPPHARLTSQFQHRILDYLPEDPDHILMEFDPEGYGRRLDASRIDIRTGHAVAVVVGDEFTAGYDVDRQGRVRLRYQVRDKHHEFRVRDLETRRWRTFQRSERDEGFELRPLAFTEDGRGLLVLKPGPRGFDAIHEFDLTTSTLGERVFGPPDVDVLGVVTDPYTREVLGATHATHYPTTYYFDEAFARIQHLVDEALPETQNSIVSHDRNRRRFVVWATAPRFPGTYYLFDREKLELAPLGRRYASRLEPEQLADVEPTSYEARDGLVIPAYLTRSEADGPLPMVVLPHGGPTARDYLGFDPLAQFLASRGYAVLQPNFRGSSGYGGEFELAGYGEWGLAMQDDITDGVLAMIERRVADPERICIVGWSYGGYAALMGAVKTPELYRCAVSGAGVTDIRKLLAERSRYKFVLKNVPSIGDARADKHKLKDTSPIDNAEAIRAPILLVHGDKDLSVPVGHSKRMAARLAKLGKPHKLVILKDGDHDLSLERNSVRFFRELESFLAEHLAGRGDRAPRAVRESVDD